MLIRLVVVGNVKEQYYRNLIEGFVSNIKRNNSFELVELSDESIPKNAKESIMNNIKEIEGKKILENIKKSEYVVALCIDGKKMSSENFKNMIREKKNSSIETLTFVIGGSLGLSDKVVNRANFKLSFSDMTFPHQLMRVMLLEQISYV